jgi:hypothetical protein
MFLPTKVWVANYPDRAFAAPVDESLRLRTDYIDLLLLEPSSVGLCESVDVAERGDHQAALVAVHFGRIGFFSELLFGSTKETTNETLLPINSCPEAQNLHPIGSSRSQLEG